MLFPYQINIKNQINIIKKSFMSNRQELQPLMHFHMHMRYGPETISTIALA